MPVTIQLGMSIDDFWELSYKEIITFINAKKERLENDIKKNSENIYMLADLIGASVARLFGKNNKMPKIQEVFPIFKKDTKEDWKTIKEKLLDYADAHNAGRGENY